MSTQQQEQAESRARQRRQLRERRFLILGITLLFLLGGAALWILNSQGIVRGSWSSTLLILFTVLGVVVGLFQWLFPISSPPPPQRADTAAALPTPQIIVQVPPAASPRPPQPAVKEKAAYRGIVALPPPTDQRSIQQRQLLLAFAAFHEPVPVAAVETVLGEAAQVGTAQLHAALDALLAQNLLQATGEGRYQLHPIVAQYALGHFVEGDEAANRAAMRDAHARAAASAICSVVLPRPPPPGRAAWCLPGSQHASSPLALTESL